MAFFMAYKRGVTNPLLTGMIHQVVLQKNKKLLSQIIGQFLLSNRLWEGISRCFVDTSLQVMKVMKRVQTWSRIRQATLPRANSLQLKIDGWKMKFPLWDGIFCAD